MKYAATYHIGHDSKTRKVKAKKVAPTGKRIYGMDAADKGCGRNRKEQSQIRSAANAANGFLKTTFLPKLEKVTTLQDATKIKRTEDDFYLSLHRMENHYAGFAPTDTRAFGFPYNMALSVWETENRLKRIIKDWSGLRLVQDDKGKTYITTEHRYHIGTILYYIPIVPLYKMLKNKSTKRTANLLLSVCAYLYHIADIPYYRQENSYLYWQYEMLTEWVAQDEDTEEEDNRLHELEVAQCIGDRMEKKLWNRKNLEWMAARIEAFAPETDYERECLQLAERAMSLYKDYPDTNIFQHGTYARYEDEQDLEVIRMDKYISFVADTKGWLYESLVDCINNEFNEYGEMEEPMIEKRFDGESPVTDNLEFEDRLFNLIGDLCCLLCND